MPKKTKSDSSVNGPPQDRITLKQVRDSFNRNVPNPFAVTWLVRPAADLITPLFYNTCWTANQVTVFRILLGLAGVLVLLAGPPWWTALGGAIFYLCCILDCVDGNIARLRDQASYWGKFIDGLADFIFVLGAPLAAGVAVWLHDGDAVFMLIGALISVTSLASQMTRARLSFMREWMVSQSGPVSAAAEQTAAMPRRIQAVVASVFVNGTFAAPVLLLIPATGPAWYVLALVPLQLIPELIWLTATIAEARILLDRGRRSRHAAIGNSEQS